jgi:hypothetical protein
MWGFLLRFAREFFIERRECQAATTYSLIRLFYDEKQRN